VSALDPGKTVPSKSEPLALSTRPLVSVVVSCYNYGHFVTATVQSVLDQEGVDVDVILIDDASTDDSLEVLRGLAADPRVSLIEHAQNQGYLAAYNGGFGKARGDYVVKLDADDLLLPGSLARATALLEAHPEISFSYGRPWHFTSGTPAFEQGEPDSWSIWSGHDWLELRCRRGCNCISNPEVVIRTSALNQVGGFRDYLPHTCDFDLWMRLCAVGDVGRVNGVYQGAYRVHAASMQRTVNAGHLVDLRGRRDAFDSVFTGAGPVVADPAGLHEQARRRLALESLDWACRAYDRGRVESEPVQGYLDFAVETWPEVTGSGAWRALRRRRRLGPRYARLFPPFVARAVLRRLADELGDRRWKRSGT
jgi:glycosyltransferase involved in cell wall biosynthesis